MRREASIHSHVRMRHAIPPRYPIQTPEEDSEYSGNRKRDLTESTKTVHKITEDSTPTVQLPTKYSGDFQFGSAVGVNSKVISPTSSRSPSSTSHAANLRSDSSLAQGLNRLSDRICDVPAAVSSVAHFGNESTYSLGHPALSQLISGMQHSDARISYSSCYRNPFIDEDNSLIDLSRTLYDSAEEVSSCSALVSNCCNEERDYSTIGTRVQDGIDCDGGGYSVHGRGKWSVDYCQSECQYVVSRSVDREDTFQESLRDFPDELHKDLGDFESGISLVDSVRCLMIPDDGKSCHPLNPIFRR